MSINRVNITGNLTRDPEMRYSQGGTAILAYGVAVNDRRKNPNTGKWEDYPNFIDCVSFGSYAESLQQHLYKGMKVAIEGRLHYQSWEKDGQRRSKVEVVAESVEFLAQSGSRQQSAPPQQPTYSAPPQRPQQQPQQAELADVYDEDIPF